MYDVSAIRALQGREHDNHPTLAALLRTDPCIARSLVNTSLHRGVPWLNAALRDQHVANQSADTVAAM